MASSQASVVVGLAMGLTGLGLWGVAAYAQAQRAAEAAAKIAPQCSSAAPAQPPAPTTAATAAPSAPASGATASGGAAASGTAPAASSAPGAAASGSAAAPAASAGSASEGSEQTFRFDPGGIVLPKSEVTRLVAYCRELQKQPRIKILIEGFGDDASAAGALLGRRRALLVRQLLSDVGFDSERLVLTPQGAPPSAPLTTVVRVQPLEPKTP